MLHRIDVNQFIDELCQRLEDTEFEDYNEENDFLLDVGHVVTEFSKALLGEMASIWVKGQDKGKSKTFWAFGTDFFPMITLDVREMPAVAIEAKLAINDSNLSDSINTAIGQAILDSVQYPYVVVFILDKTNSDEYKHWLDSEIETSLWDNHAIRVIVRQ